MRNLIDETDGIDDHDLVAVGQAQRSGRRVQSREQFVLDKHAGAGEQIHQRRLAGVGVADQGDRSEGHFVALAPLQAARALDGGQAALQVADALANAPAVDFQLGFTRAAGADAAAQARQVGPLARQSRHEIFQLRQLHLQLAFVAARPLGEDVEDQLAAVDDANFEGVFQIALLRRRQILVNDDQDWRDAPAARRKSRRPCRGRSKSPA